MKILIVASRMDIGGAETLTAHLANHFVEHGHDAVLFLIQKECNKSIDLVSNNVNVIYVPKPILSLMLLWKIGSVYKFDAVLCQSISAYLVYKISRIFMGSPPVYLSLHFTQKFGFKNCFFLKVLFFILKRSHDIIINSYRKQSELFSARYRISMDYFYPIYNGTKINNNLGKKLYFTNNCLNIVHVANHRPEKDQDTLFESLRILNKINKKWVCFFRGNMPDGIRVMYERLIDEYGLVHQVQFVDFISDINALYRSMDVFVLTSIVEALPMTAIEAMSAGVPCILTDVGGCSEIVDDGLNGFLVPTKRPDQIAEKLRFLIENRSKLVELGTNAQLKAAACFDIQQISDQYLKLFER